MTTFDTLTETTQPDYARDARDDLDEAEAIARSLPVAHDLSIEQRLALQANIIAAAQARAVATSAAQGELA
jgi:hypothetical protein